MTRRDLIELLVEALIHESFCGVCAEDSCNNCENCSKEEAFEEYNRLTDHETP